jgi:hypothetical protein
MIAQDHEREHLKDLLFIHADRMEEEQRIMQEINEEEHKRLPARITVIKPQTNDKFKDNTVSFRGTNQEKLFT